MADPRNIEKNGLWVEYNRVHSCTSRALRTMLEDQKPHELHLCRSPGCGVGDTGRLHFAEYAALDAGAIVDLGAHSKFSACRACVLLWRTWGWAVRILVRILGGCCPRC